jgi:hypothetical protein
MQGIVQYLNKWDMQGEHELKKIAFSEEKIESDRYTFGSNASTRYDLTL